MADFPTDTGAISYELIEAQRVPARGTITLLHNFMSTGRAAWGPLLPQLSEDYQILLPDLPGHGKSLGFPPEFDHVTIARQIAALMHSLQVDGGHLAGCSSGGMVAQLLVHTRLVAPRTLTLVSTTYSTNPATTDNYASITPERFQAARNWMEATARLHDPYRYDGYYARELLPGFRQLSPERAIDLPLSALRRFQLPVLVIHGERDEFFPSYIAQNMADTLPQSELHLIPGQTHALLFRQPWQVARLMLEFLTKFSTHDILRST
jgi:3-oxoadipate enol-lactonase